LNQFNSHLVPCPGSFNGNWEEEVSTRKITILGGLIGSRFIALLLLYLRGRGQRSAIGYCPRHSRLGAQNSSAQPNYFVTNEHKSECGSLMTAS